MKKLNVLQKLIAYIAVCFALAAVLAFSGSGYSLWVFDGDSNSAGIAELDGGVTVWYRTVTVYAGAAANEDAVIWETGSYPSQSVLSLDFEQDGVTMKKAIYGMLSKVTIEERAYLSDGNAEVGHFVIKRGVTPETADNYFHLGNSYFELVFNNNFIADKDYNLFVIYS